MLVRMTLPDGTEGSYSMPVLKLKQYDIKTIFDKELYLIPFYLFNLEKSFLAVEYEAKTILKKGIAQGISQGLSQGEISGGNKMLYKLVSDGLFFCNGIYNEYQRICRGGSTGQH